MISKLMGLASIGGSLANISLLHRFLEGIIGLIALTIVGAMMAGMLILSCFYGIYAGLTRYGLDPDAALLAIIGLALLLTIICFCLALTRLRHLRLLPDLMMPREALPLRHMARLAQAFIKGFGAGITR